MTRTNQRQPNRIGLSAIIAVIAIIHIGPTTSNARAEFYHPQNESGPYDTRDPNSDSETAWNNLVFYGACGAISAPYWGPYVLLQQDYLREPSNDIFKPYPYAPLDSYDDERIGFMADKSYLSECEESARVKNWSLRLDCDYGDQIRSGQNRVGTHLLFESTWRLGIDMQYDWLHEFNFYQPQESMSLGDWNLTFRFADSPRWQFRSGFGMNWSADENEGDIGFNFTYGFDVYPIRPLIISNSIDWGTLGHDELFRYRCTAGVIINRFECYTGYEYLDLDHEQRNYLLAGVRIWL